MVKFVSSVTDALYIYFILICWYTCRHKVKKICKAEKKYIPQVGAKIKIISLMDFPMVILNSV